MKRLFALVVVIICLVGLWAAPYARSATPVPGPPPVYHQLVPIKADMMPITPHSRVYYRFVPPTVHRCTTHRAVACSWLCPRTAKR